MTEQVQLAIDDAPDLGINIAEIAQAHLIGAIAAVLRRKSFRIIRKALAIGSTGKQPRGPFPVDRMTCIAQNGFGLVEITNRIIPPNRRPPEETHIDFFKGRSRPRDDRQQGEGEEYGADAMYGHGLIVSSFTSISTNGAATTNRATGALSDMRKPQDTGLW